MPVEAYAGQSRNFNILRVYSLRLSYEYCKQLDRDKSISANLASHCIIIRQKPVINNTDFGYKEELKTGPICIFIQAHKAPVRNSQFPATKPFQTDSKHEIINLNQRRSTIRYAFNLKHLNIFRKYFYIISPPLIDIINYQNMGTKLFLFIKLLKVLQNLMPFNSNICFTYSYTPEQCNYVDLMSYLKSENITFWRVGAQKLDKNGYSYESQWTRKFFEIYEIQEEEKGEQEEEEGRNVRNS